MTCKISRVRTHIVSVPLAEPFAIATQTMAACEHILAIVDTDSGVAGVGSVSTIPAFMGETGSTVRAGIEYLAPFLAGRDAFDMETMVDLMDRELLGNPSAKAAIDFACHDIMGKSLGMPVHRLIGGLYRRQVPCTWVIGIKDVDATVAEGVARYQEGFHVLKVKIGHDDQQDIEKVRLLRAELGPSATIRIDANTAYTVDRAMRVLPRLEEYGLEMIEQPCRGHDLAGMARLRHALKTPILADESAMSLEQVHELIKVGAADIINVKLGKIGGLHKARKAAAVAEAANLPIVVGSNMELGPGIAAGIHFAAATACARYANDIFAGAYLHAEEIVSEPWEREGMRLAVPGEPGLGVTLAPGVWTF